VNVTFHLLSRRLPGEKPTSSTGNEFQTLRLVSHYLHVNKINTFITERETPEENGKFLKMEFMSYSHMQV